MEFLANQRQSFFLYVKYTCCTDWSVPLTLPSNQPPSRKKSFQSWQYSLLSRCFPIQHSHPLLLCQILYNVFRLAPSCSAAGSSIVTSDSAYSFWLCTCHVCNYLKLIPPFAMKARRHASHEIKPFRALSSLFNLCLSPATTCSSCTLITFFEQPESFHCFISTIVPIRLQDLMRNLVLIKLNTLTITAPSSSFRSANTSHQSMSSSRTYPTHPFPWFPVNVVLRQLLSAFYVQHWQLSSLALPQKRPSLTGSVQMATQDLVLALIYTNLHCPLLQKNISFLNSFSVFVSTFIKNTKQWNGCEKL